MPHLPWSIASPADVKEPMVGADENCVLLIPAKRSARRLDP